MIEPEKVKQYRSAPLYLTNETAYTHGLAVSTLLVAHCELNPIELAWPSVKGYVAKHNNTHDLLEIEWLTSDRFTNTTTDMWKNFVELLPTLKIITLKKMELLRTQ